MGRAAAHGFVTADQHSHLLDGLSGDARAERAELIDWLLGQGIDADEIQHSFAPMLLPARHLLGDDGTYVSARQISAGTGLELDALIRFQRAAGLPHVADPDEPVFMRRDGDTAVHVKRFLDLGFDPDQMLAVVRVLADGLAHAAEVMRGAVLAAVLRPGVSELEIARGSQAVVGAAAPLLGSMIEDLLLLQLRHTVETEAVNANERAVGAALPGARLVAVAFADLVGFTRLGEQVPPEELEKLANRLGEHAREVAVAPVRFIKTIGDAVMFVAPDTGALLEAVLRLIDAAEADEMLPQLRAGVAYGPAVSRAGDWFGSPVNTASRVTSIARPGSVLVSEAVQDSVGEDNRFTWSAAGSRHLRGIRDAVKLFRARPAQDGPVEVRAD